MASVSQRELHHRACVKAKPDPVDLAGRLFRREVDGESDIFIGSVGTYGKVLGKKGVAEFRRLAEARWATAPVAPGGKDPARYGSRSVRGIEGSGGSPGQCR